LEQKHNEILVLKYTNEELQDINSSLHRHLEETRTKMQTEISALKGEKEEALNNLQQLNTSVKTLEEQLEHLSEQLSVFQIANEDLQDSNSNLKMQLEGTEVSHRSEVLTLQDEKNKVFSELKQSETSFN
jgi:septal ring factor EnvC (AmiA/AmiB activator)